MSPLFWSHPHGFKCSFVLWAGLRPFPVASHGPAGDSLDFINPDGSLASRHTGTCVPDQAFRVEGTFNAAGKGKVVFRGVTPQGVGVTTDAGELEVEVS